MEKEDTVVQRERKRGKKRNGRGRKKLPAGFLSRLLTQFPSIFVTVYLFYFSMLLEKVRVSFKFDSLYKFVLW